MAYHDPDGDLNQLEIPPEIMNRNNHYDPLNGGYERNRTTTDIQLEQWALEREMEKANNDKRPIQMSLWSDDAICGNLFLNFG